MQIIGGRKKLEAWRFPNFQIWKEQRLLALRKASLSRKLIWILKAILVDKKTALQQYLIWGISNEWKIEKF